MLFTSRYFFSDLLPLQNRTLDRFRSLLNLSHIIRYPLWELFCAQIRCILATNLKDGVTLKCLIPLSFLFCSEGNKKDLVRVKLIHLSFGHLERRQLKGELKGEDANQPLFSYLLLEDDFGNEVSFLLSTSWTLDTQIALIWWCSKLWAFFAEHALLGLPHDNDDVTKIWATGRLCGLTIWWHPW